jgi:signal transduction histidine kinase
MDGGNIIVSVSDTGCGLTKEVQNKLFKEMITNKGKEGTGLGLYMSYSMIKAKFKGDITFTTSKEGTTFNVILPWNVD